jgi:exopolyphosphatase/guanosine-5'-triphosphate,3'-diphosphate pyrophosphatase
VSEDRRVAVVDLGSNSFRLVVFTAQEGWWKRTDEIYEAVRVGEGMGKTGRIGKKPAARALAAIELFAHFCTASGIGRRHVDAVATSAIREATNSEEFLKRARDASFMPIRVLSREEEARYGYLAAVNSTTLSDGVVLDLGGGSMQLVAVAGRHARELESWKLGAVLVTERFLADGEPVSRKRLREVRTYAERKLESAPWIARSGSRLVGIGGTVRNLAAAAQRHVGIPSFGVQGHVITREVLEELVDRLAALPAAERGSVPGIKPSRADLILAGALVIQAVLEAGGFDGLETTEAGLREGVFFERLPAGEGDPPLFEDVRRASVLNLAAQYGVDPAHTAHVGHLALGLFDELAAAGLHPGDPLERELLWAACTLHDIGVTIDYDDHHKHSRYLILNGGLPGYQPAEVALIAQIARYHRKGIPELGPFRALARKGDAERLTRCATLVRLAEGLERARDQMVEHAHVAASDGEVRLDLVASGDVSVPRWAAARETELFQLAFDRRLVVAEA